MHDILASRLANFREALRRWGFFRTSFIYVLKVLQLYGGVNLYQVRRRPFLDQPPSIPAGYEVRTVGADEAARWAADPELELSLDSVRTAFQRGEVMTGVFTDGRLVAYIWAGTSTVPHEGDVWASIEPLLRGIYRYGYKAFTRPSFRGRRLNRLAALSSEQTFVDRGCSFSLSCNSATNLASAAAGRSMGDEVVGWAGYARLFTTTLVFRSPGAKRAGFRFVCGGD